MGFTPYGRKLLLDSTFMSGVRPTTVYFALTSSVPGPIDDGMLLVEPAAGTNYARLSYAVASGFYTTSAGEITNARELVFATPSTDWGMVRGWAMVTTSTRATGLVIVCGPLGQPKRASAGTKLRLNIDALKLSVR